MIFRDNEGMNSLDGIRILDNPLRKRGLGSRPFDAEGLATRRLAVIDDGRLTTWLLDLAAARQLNLKPTGHASRGTSGWVRSWTARARPAARR